MPGARGGTGFIIVENTTVQHPQGRGTVAKAMAEP